MKPTNTRPDHFLPDCAFRELGIALETRRASCSAILEPSSHCLNTEQADPPCSELLHRIYQGTSVKVGPSTVATTEWNLFSSLGVERLLLSNLRLIQFEKKIAETEKRFSEIPRYALQPPLCTQFTALRV